MRTPLVLALCFLAVAAGVHAVAPRDAAPGATLRIKGSDTMVHLVTAWTEAYMKLHPEASISVTGGGSGTGIAAMIDGTTDLCMSSREVTAKEVERARAKQVTFHPTAVARDGIAIVVHPSNPLAALDLEQLRRIYSGADHKFQVLSRESSSGTYAYFREAVLGKVPYAREVRLMPSTAAIVLAVSQDAPAIGYVGLGYAREAGVKVVPIKKDAQAPAVLPDAGTISSGRYPLSRELHVYTRGLPAGLARDFIAFALSPAGQRVVEEAGYVRVR